MTDWGLFLLYIVFLVSLSVAGYVWNAVERMKAMKKGREHNE